MQKSPQNTSPNAVSKTARLAGDGWLKSYLRLLAHGAVAVAVIAAGMVVVQVLYPRSLTTPLLQVNGVHVGIAGDSALQSKLSPFNQQKVSIQAAQKTYEQTYEEIGVSIDMAQTINSLKKYSLRDRLIPFSLFRLSNTPAASLRHDDSKLLVLAQKIQTENTIPATNATVVLEAGEYKIAKDSINGQTYQPEQVMNSIKSANPGKTKTVDLPEAAVEPAITSAEASTTITQLKRQTTQKTYLKVGKDEFLIPSKDLKKFIAISFDKKKNLLTSTYDKKAIQKFSSRIAAKIYVAPKQAVVKVHDGQTRSSTEGKNGRQLSVHDTSKAILKGLKDNKQTIEVEAKTVSLAARFVRSYSSNNKGLAILLQDWQDDTGLSAGVVVRELGGRGRSASLNGNQSFLMASLAKLNLIHYLYDGIQKDKWTLNSKLGTSQSVGSCIESMIVVSNNECFKSIGANRGWGNITSFTQAQGFTSTNPNPAIYTTNAQDMAWYLQRLYAGNLVTSSQRSSLLGYMQRQIYRGGIPAGSRGAVADKVGYWGSYRNDAGIVYHPRSTYVLVILTNGGSDYRIADLARRVSKFMDQ